MFNPIWDPELIESKSFEIIDSLVPPPERQGLSQLEWPVVRRMIHTTGDIELAKLVRLSPRAVESGIEALFKGLPVVTDTKMALTGISQRRLAPWGITPVCLMDHPETALMAKERGITRAAAAVRLAAESMGRIGIFAIGNAPTALLTLLRLVESGDMAPPELTIGVPVGFVSAAESKEELMASGLTHITIQGNKGGSAMAAAAVNAISILASEQEKRS